MPRRLLPLVASVLVAFTSVGCAEDVDPAARVGDAIEISHDELLAEVEIWADSPLMLDAVQVGAAQGAGPGSYSMALVDSVLTFRIRFDLHSAKFDELELELSDEELEQVGAGLFGDAVASAATLEELGKRYGDQLVADAARQFAVVQAMSAEEYEAWQRESFASGNVEVSARYGSWDSESRSVAPPQGPRPAPGADPFAGL